MSSHDMADLLAPDPTATVRPTGKPSSISVNPATSKRCLETHWQIEGGEHDGQIAVWPIWLDDCDGMSFMTARRSLPALEKLGVDCHQLLGSSAQHLPENDEDWNPEQARGCCAETLCKQVELSLAHVGSVAATLYVHPDGWVQVKDLNTKL